MNKSALKNLNADRMFGHLQLMLKSNFMLIVDDDAKDCHLLVEAFEDANVKLSFYIAHDGDEAIHYLSGDGAFGDRDRYPVPALLLLDLKMPKVSGFEVLQWMRQQPGLKRMPVTILTSSDEPRDVDTAFELGANSFVRKPYDWERYRNMAAKLYDYWFAVNLCPNCSADAHSLKVIELPQKFANR